MLRERARHELARAIALEDDEPWRLADPVTDRQRRSAQGAALEFNRLRSTPIGMAKLARALAQGEVGRVFQCTEVRVG